MFPVVGSALSKTSRRLKRRARARARREATDLSSQLSPEAATEGDAAALGRTRRAALCGGRVAITRTKARDFGPERNTDDDRSNIAISSNLAITREIQSAFGADSLARSLREREKERPRRRRRKRNADTLRSAVNSECARVAARKLKAINHACVSHRRPMNINENHCAVYRPINPGVKIFRLWWCFIARCSALSGSGTVGGTSLLVLSIIRPEDRPPFLDPLCQRRLA